MTRGEAEAILGMIKSNWNMWLDDYGVEMWMRYLGDQDLTLATEAFQTLTRQKERPTIADFRSIITKIEADRRAAVPAVAEAEFKREIPLWAKGWLVARAEGDLRVWPEQQPGYDNLQREHVHDRTYVWVDQEEMPPTDREAFQAKAALLSAAEIEQLMAGVGL